MHDEVVTCFEQAIKDSLMVAVNDMRNSGVSFLQNLRNKNVARCKDGFGKEVTDWSEMQWGCAIAGEVGELCNILKKRERDADTSGKLSNEEVGKEIADAILYLDLLAARVGIDLESAIVQKFNEVSARRGSQIVLP